MPLHHSSPPQCGLAIRVLQRLAIFLLLISAVTSAQAAAPHHRADANGTAAATVSDRPKPSPIEIPSAPPGAPNIVVILLDDVGYGATSTFGGVIPTPALDRLAQQGLRYTRFHTTAICSPTRAALLTGRNHHSVGMGMLADLPMGYPGYNTMMPQSAATIAEVLRSHGYATSAWGKWHLAPIWERSPAGPHDHWPTHMGFDEYYGFIGGETDQFEPDLYDGVTPVSRPDRRSYHLTEDLVDQAVSWMRQQRSLRPMRPFFVYFAPGATHAPLQVPAAWRDRFKGRFDGGWDELRKGIFAHQKRQKIIPANADLTPRPAAIPAWESLSPSQKKLAARLMELYAAFLAHTDAQIGRLLDSLREMDAFDNTLVLYVVGDNGASAEAGPEGSINMNAAYQGVSLDVSLDDQQLNALGGPHSHPGYPAGWAWAMDTPFQWFKQVASHFGGMRNPLVVSWPARIKRRGEVRTQFHHVIDIAPTIYEAVGIQPPAEMNGVPQQPIEGVSMEYSFDDPAAKSRHTTQYFEIMANRAIYHDGWIASAFHGNLPWQVARTTTRPLSDDVWELYNLESDFSQAHDVAAQHPDRLAQLEKLFWREAERDHVIPIEDRMAARPLAFPASLVDRRTRITYYGPTTRASLMPRTMMNRSYSVEASVTIPDGGAHGVLIADGGYDGGWSLFLDQSGKLAYLYSYFGLERTSIDSPSPVAAGPHTIRMDFAYAGGGYGKGADVTLSVDQKRAASGHVERTPPGLFSVSEPMDVGTDSLSPVGDYPVNFAFTGDLDRLVIDLK